MKKILYMLGYLFMFEPAYAAEFKEATSAAASVFQSLRQVAYVLAGFGLAAFAVSAIFGKISFKWLGLICCGLFILAFAGSIAQYITGSTVSGIEEQAPTVKPGDDPASTSDGGNTDSGNTAEVPEGDTETPTTNNQTIDPETQTAANNLNELEQQAADAREAALDQELELESARADVNAAKLAKEEANQERGDAYSKYSAAKKEAAEKAKAAEVAKTSGASETEIETAQKAADDAAAARDKAKDDLDKARLEVKQAEANIKAAEDARSEEALELVKKQAAAADAENAAWDETPWMQDDWLDKPLTERKEILIANGEWSSINQRENYNKLNQDPTEAREEAKNAARNPSTSSANATTKGSLNTDF